MPCGQQVVQANAFILGWLCRQCPRLLVRRVAGRQPQRPVRQWPLEQAVAATMRTSSFELERRVFERLRRCMGIPGEVAHRFASSFGSQPREGSGRRCITVTYRTRWFILANVRRGIDRRLYDRIVIVSIEELWLWLPEVRHLTA